MIDSNLFLVSKELEDNLNFLDFYGEENLESTKSENFFYDLTNISLIKFKNKNKKFCLFFNFSDDFEFFDKVFDNKKFDCKILFKQNEYILKGTRIKKIDFIKRKLIIEGIK